jgi:hypothetical protein
LGEELVHEGLFQFNPAHFGIEVALSVVLAGSGEPPIPQARDYEGEGFWI